MHRQMKQKIIAPFALTYFCFRCGKDAGARRQGNRAAGFWFDYVWNIMFPLTSSTVCACMSTPISPLLSSKNSSFLCLN